MNLPTWLLGLALACAAAAAAWRLRWLTGAGAWAAMLVGWLTLAGGGWGAAGLLLAFFVSSNVLSRLGLGGRAEMGRVVSKGGRRDAWQVLANGAVAALMAAGYGLSGQGAVWLAGTVGAWAAATADTWGTEWGAFSKQAPTLITGGGPVPPGTSGGVTPLGWLGSAAGGLFIGALAAILWDKPILLPGGLVGGLVGSALDSLLGAKVQGLYRCPQCALLTEQSPRHVCGTPTVPVRGFRWVGNDLVNLLATLSGAAVVSGFALLARGG